MRYSAWLAKASYANKIFICWATSIGLSKILWSKAVGVFKKWVN